MMNKPQRSYLDRSYQYTGEDDPLKPLGEIINLTGKKIILELPFMGYKKEIPKNGKGIHLWEQGAFTSCIGIYQLVYPEVDLSQFWDTKSTFIVPRDVALLLYKGNAKSRTIMFPSSVYDETDDKIVCEGFTRLDCNYQIENF
jgi:hypothetical protein